MKRTLLLILLLSASLFAQTIVNTYPFPRYVYYDYFWGITQKADTFWIGTTYTPTTAAYAKIYKVTKSGSIVDSLTGPLKSNHGIEWDGTNFWVADEYHAPNSRIYKMTTEGTVLDSFVVPLVQGLATHVGDIALDGNNLWYTVFSPDFPTYPNSWAFAFDTNTKQIVDSIPLHGRQVLGIAVKGDTIFYVNENQYTSETERIFAFSKTLKDTIFSFPAPDPDGNCNPKSLYWDGNFLYLIAERIGGSAWVYKTLYQYAITGGGNPVISVEPEVIDFGNVPIGQSLGRTLSVSNNGNENLIITQLEINNTVFSLPSLNLPDTIAPGLFKNYTITFTPAQFDSAIGILNVYSNDGTSPVTPVNLKGKGVYSGSYLYISPDNYSFGLRRLNSLCGWIFTLKNLGNQDLHISSASLSSSTFIFDTVGVSFPFTIVPQAERNLRVWFNPENSISYSDSLLISSDAANIPQLYIHLTGSGEVRQYTMGEILWADYIPFNPTAYTNDYQPMSVKRLPDVNGDGVDEIIAASRNYLVTCYNGNSSGTGDILWSFNTGYNNNNTGAVMFQDALQVRTDVDGDGINDIAFGCGGGNEFVYTISGRTGKLIWAYGDSIDYSRGDINGLRADKDFNNDGVNDVLVSASGSSTGGRHAAICLNGINGSEIFNLVQNASYTYDITSTQGGGVIAVDINNGGPYYLNGFTNAGLFTWTIQVPEVVWSMREIKDLTGDGIKDFVGYCGGLNVNVFARNAATGALIWNVPYPNFSTFASIKLISDLNQNGYEDMIFSGKEGVFRLDTQNGITIWSNTLDGSYVFGIDEMGDLNSDGINEITAGTKNANVYILNGLNGQIMNQYSFGTPINSAAERVINAGNVDDNYSDDFTAACKDGRITCFSGGQAGPVPVELASFNAEVRKKDVYLSWSTASEKNNSGFKIMLNGRELLFVKGNGTVNRTTNYSAVIRDLENGIYMIKLVQVDLDGSSKVFAEKEIEINSLPVEFSLQQNYPNPFNPVTTISYDVKYESLVEIKIYNILGNEAATVINKIHMPGSYSFNFDASALSSGVYIYRIRAGEYTASRKMILLK